MDGHKFRASPSMGLLSVVSVQSIAILINLTYTQTCLLSPVCIYVAFRTPNPDEETMDALKEDLKKNDLDFNQLVKFETNHC
jgi:hypothetical protein